MQDLLILKKGLYKKDQNVIMCAKIKKKATIVIINVIRSEGTIMHKEGRPSHYFFHLFHIKLGCEDKKEEECVQNLLARMHCNLPFQG